MTDECVCPCVTLDKQVGQALNMTAESQGSQGDYTLIYFGSPHEPPHNYVGDFGDSPVAQMELRRRSDVVLGRADDAKNITNAPLFVKYQFFTPGKLCSQNEAPFLREVVC